MKQQILPAIENMVLIKVIAHPHLDEMPAEALTLRIQDFVNLGFVSKKYKRKIFVACLRTLKRNLKGKEGRLIRKLYLDLDFDKYAFKELSASHSYKPLLALNELVFFEAPDPEGLIGRLLYSKNKYLKEKALEYIFKVYKGNVFEYFSQVTAPFTKWEHLHYFDIITNRKDGTLPEFSRWITPPYNESLILLCLDFTTYYRQHSAAPAIIELLQQSAISTELKCKLISALGQLYESEALPVLLDLYADEKNILVKGAILKALSNISGNETLSFLKQSFKKEASPFLKKHAARSILEIEGPEPVMDTLLEEATDAEDINALKHAMSPLIKYY
ncbi:MAG: HEAT repeat domain-containing protein [Niabella sp.]|nr:HEAT repeat domain-containing protein [Niabella sp.]